MEKCTDYLKNREAIWLSSPTLGNASGENQYLKGYMNPNVHCNTINSQGMEEAQMFFDGGMNKDVVHMHNEILLSHKKKQNSAICRDMDEPRECHPVWSQKALYK